MSERRGKYNNVRTQIGSQRFDSRREAERYLELAQAQREGRIEGLRCQVPYDLVVNGYKVCRYVADFEYYENGQKITEDVKGCRTREYSIKRKLMKAVFGITIRET